mgnify:CR=1 FL=1
MSNKSMMYASPVPLRNDSFQQAPADAITAAFSEYTKLVLSRGKSKRPSILQQLKQFGEKARSRPREQQRKREVAHEDR